MIHSINLLSCISLLIGLVTVNGSPINTSPQLQSRTEMWIVGYDFLEPNAGLAEQLEKQAYINTALRPQNPNSYTNGIYATPHETVKEDILPYVGIVTMESAAPLSSPEIQRLYIPRKEVPRSKEEFEAYLKKNEATLKSKAYTFEKTVIYSYSSKLGISISVPAPLYSGTKPLLDFSWKIMTLKTFKALPRGAQPPVDWSKFTPHIDHWPKVKPTST